MWITGLIFAVSGVVHAQHVFRTYAGEAYANVDLPVHVKATDGELTLWADFEKRSQEGTPLYLVNKTRGTVSFPSQDGDIYIKLESFDKNGGWGRAQTHEYSDCGNSYGHRILQPGMHYRLLGYQAAEGRKADIRYAMHSGLNLVSNTGSGLVSDKDIELARFDSMSLRSVPRTIRDAFDPQWKRSELKPGHRAGCLLLLKAYGPVPALKREAQRQLDAWRLVPPVDSEEKQAAAAFEELLFATWEKEISSERLVQFCLDQIEGTKPALQATPAMCWETLRDLASLSFGVSVRTSRSNKVETPSEDWRRVVRLAASRISEAPKEEAISMSGVLSHNLLVDSFLPSSALEPLLSGEPYFAAKVAANALSRRGDTERLSELAMNLPPKNQPVVLASLASGGVSYEHTGLDGWGGLRRPEPDTKEETFWTYVMGTQPLEASDALRYLSPHDLGADGYGPIVMDGLRKFWNEEAARSQNRKDDFALAPPAYSLRLSLDFLAKSQRKEDAPLFRSLLAYKGYELQEGFRDDGSGGGAKPYKMQSFGVRQAALEALKAIGEQAPSDVVLEKDVSNPEKVIQKTNGDL